MRRGHRRGGALPRPHRPSDLGWGRAATTAGCRRRQRGRGAIVRALPVNPFVALIAPGLAAAGERGHPDRRRRCRAGESPGGAPRAAVAPRRVCTLHNASAHGGRRRRRWRDPSTPKGPLVTSASSRLLTLPASLPDEAGAAAAGDGSADEDPAAPPSATSPASSSTSSSSAAISLGVATAGTGRESHDGASFFGAKVEAVRDVVQRAADVLTLPAIATQRGTSSEGAGPRGRASAQHKGHHHQVGTPSISSSTASPASLRRMLSTEARF